MKFGFVDEHRNVWPVRIMCAALGLSASGYYAWRTRPESRRACANRALLEDIHRIHADSSGTYGSPRVHAVLRGHGRRVGRSRIERLMRRAGLRGLAALPRRTRTTDSRRGYPIAPNRLGRNFTSQAPNQVWLADLTYIPTGEGWLYLATVLDLFTRKIVGWSMRPTLHVEIALDALQMAIQRQRPAPGLIHHSDRGIQYAAEAYRSALARAGVTPSMSRKGDCWDNAPMESFFHTLKTERVHHRVYATRDQARRDLFQCIEGFSTIPAACTQLWATSVQRTPSVERLNPVHFSGGRSLARTVVPGSRIIQPVVGLPFGNVPGPLKMSLFLLSFGGPGGLLKEFLRTVEGHFGPLRAVLGTLRGHRKCPWAGHACAARAAVSRREFPAQA